MTPSPSQPAEPDWQATTWEGSRRSQLEYWAGLSLDEIFAAQEEMAEFARALADAPPLAEHSAQRADAGSGEGPRGR